MLLLLMLLKNMRLSNTVLFNATKYIREISYIDIKGLFDKNDNPLFPKLRKIYVIFNENDDIKVLFELLKKLINGTLMIIKINITYNPYNCRSIKNYALLYILSSLIHGIESLSIVCKKKKRDSTWYQEYGIYKLIRNNNNNNIKITIWNKLGFPSIEHLVKNTKNKQTNFSLILNNKVPRYLHTINNVNIVSIIVDYKFSNMTTLQDYLIILNDINTIEVTKEGILSFCKHIKYSMNPIKIDKITKILVPFDLNDKMINSIKTMFPNAILCNI